MLNLGFRKLRCTLIHVPDIIILWQKLITNKPGWLYFCPYFKIMLIIGTRSQPGWGVMIQYRFNNVIICGWLTLAPLSLSLIHFILLLFSLFIPSSLSHLLYMYFLLSLSVFSLSPSLPLPLSPPLSFIHSLPHTHTHTKHATMNYPLAT